MTTSTTDKKAIAMTKKNNSPSGRRAFLRASLVTGGAAVLAASGCGPEELSGEEPTPPAEIEGALPETAETAETTAAIPAPALPDGLDPRNFLVHGTNPLTLETRRDKFGAAVITPASLFFVRNNLPLPPLEIVARPNAWEVEFAGVQNSRRVTVGEMKTWGVETITTVVQCSGNGRQFFAHETSGSQWGVGAAACAMWTGVPLRTVIERLGGALEDLPFLTSTGGEVLPAGVDGDSVVVERSIPRAKALGDCLLAWELNGAPLPITHGGPLRLIVPGYFGCNQIKYVKRIAFRAAETEANIMRSGYRFRPIGESGSPDQPTMWEMGVKSWINSPSGRHQVGKGALQGYGVAFSGGHGIAKVEVSLDGGESWQDARLSGPDLGPYAWRSFVFSAELEEGDYHFLSRATDLDGNVQPENRVENHRGYGHNGWRDLGVRFEAASDPVRIEEEAIEGAPSIATGPAPGSLELSEEQQAGRDLFVSDASPPCSVCHTLSEAGSSGTVGPNLNGLAPSEEQILSAVTNGVGAMPTYGEALSPEQIRQIAAYIRTVVTH